jgi:hypothetical protein
MYYLLYSNVARRKPPMKMCDTDGREGRERTRYPEFTDASDTIAFTFSSKKSQRIVNAKMISIHLNHVFFQNYISLHGYYLYSIMV